MNEDPKLTEKVHQEHWNWKKKVKDTLDTFLYDFVSYDSELSLLEFQNYRHLKDPQQKNDVKWLFFPRK